MKNWVKIIILRWLAELSSASHPFYQNLIITLDRGLIMAYHKNMEITKRQKQILNSIIKEYVELVQPISSHFLEKKYSFGIKPAMIRIEMQQLTDQGYLFQPHTSSGRVPTDKAYRFFVNNLFEKELVDVKLENWFLEDTRDTIKFIQSLTKNLALASHVLALSYLEKENIFWKEGWEEIIKAPEFEEKDYLVNFADLLEYLEKNIDEFKINSGIKVYIGKENPFPKGREFSIISSKCVLPQGKEGIISLLGPKRMSYDKNIRLINSLAKLSYE